MKLVIITTAAVLLGAGSFVLASAFQLPSPVHDAALRTTWSHPALVVDHGVQTRYALAPRGNQSNANADVLVRFESIPESTVVAMRQTYPKLKHARRTVTAAWVQVDVLGDAVPARLFRGQPAADGSGAFEVRVTAPLGGWYGQPLRLTYEASEDDRVLFVSDAFVTLGP